MEHIGKIINHLANLNRNNANQRLKKYSLTGNEGTILMMLNPDKQIYQEDIINYLRVDKSAVTRLLKNMEEKGYIKRINALNDKRYFLIKLTEKGIEKRQIVEKEFDLKNRDIVAGLSDKEQHELIRMLMIIERNLEGGNNYE